MSATLPTAVRYALPLVIAATTVIWDRLRATFKYHLQDLARVYEGLGGVSPSTLSDVETLLRLWTHECSRTPENLQWGYAVRDRITTLLGRYRACDRRFPR